MRGEQQARTWGEKAVISSFKSMRAEQHAARVEPGDRKAMTNLTLTTSVSIRAMSEAIVDRSAS